MFAVVEFLNSDGESRGEISTVPLLWLSKKSTRCYWPNKTFGLPFTEFIKRQTPFKKSWPLFKIKFHASRDTYEAAEDVASKIISDEKEYSDLTGESTTSFTQKKIHEDSFGSTGSSSDDSTRKETKMDHIVTRESQLPSRKYDSAFGTKTKTINRENNSCTEAQKCNKKNETSLEKRIARENNTSETLPKKNDEAFKTLERNTDANKTDGSETPGLNFQKDIYSSTRTPAVASPNVSSRSHSSVSGTSGVSPNNNFENVVLQTLTKIEMNVESNAIIINELLTHHKLLSSSNLVRPENLPILPIDDKEGFNIFEELLKKDKPVWDYLVRKLAAVGGSNIESFTRRIMSTLLTNKCATSFNWKGRDQKIAFCETKSLQLINESVCKSLPEGDELTIAKSIKDWLKYAKLRISQSHARATKKTCI